MKITHVAETHVAVVELEGNHHVDEVPIDHHVVSVDAGGSVMGIEVFDTRDFGEPFDAAAAGRALDWARERIERMRAAGPLDTMTAQIGGASGAPGSIMP